MEEDAFSCNDSELSAHEQEEDNYTHIQPDDEFTEVNNTSCYYRHIATSLLP